MSRDRTQIILDANAVRNRMDARAVTPKDVEHLSHGRASGQVVRRALTGKPITVSLAQHLAEALGCGLDDLRKDAVRTRIGDLMHDKESTNDVP